MKKQKLFYLFVLMIIFALTMAGCSGGGGSSDSPANDSSLPGTGGTDSVSVNGTIDIPQATAQATALATSNSDFEIIINVSDFDTDKSLTSVEAEQISQGKYKYTVTDRIKPGQNLLIEAFYEEDKTVSTYIPNLGSKFSHDIDPASTIVAEIIKKSKSDGTKVRILPEEVMNLKNKIEENYKDSLQNKDDFEEKIVEIKDGNDAFADKIQAEVEDISESNTGDIGSAKEMVSFVRNAGVFLEDSATKQEVTIKNNVEAVSSNLGSFIENFETELSPLFLSDFANRVPTNAPNSPDYYTIEDLKELEEMANYPEDINEWEWKIKDGDNTIIISTDAVNIVDESTRTIDFSSTKFTYKINDKNSSYYFDGYINTDSARTVTKTVTNGSNEKITLIIPEKAEGNIVGEVKTSNLINSASPANINIKVKQDSQISENSIDGDVSWDGKLIFPGLITYDGTLSYQGKAKVVGDLETNNIYYDYLDIQFNGEIKTDSNAEAIDKSVKIVADKLDIKTERRNNIFELDHINLTGYFVDIPKTSLWSGDLSANFKGKVSEALLTDFDFRGIIEHINYADLEIELNPELSYDQEGKLKSIVSDINVNRDNKFLKGRVDATPSLLKINLTNQAGNEFNLVTKDGKVDPAKSYIENSEGKKIAEINEDGLIYYSDENGDQGEIGSIY